MDLSDYRSQFNIKDKLCSVCGIALVDAPGDVWRRRSGTGKIKYHCDSCKKEKFSGVLLKNPTR